MTATAERSDDGRELWMPTLAPGLARAAAAATLGIAEDRVTVHPMLVGGGFGVNLEHQVAEQAALLADRLKRPVQLVWSRIEDLRHARYRPAAAARMAGRLAANGALLGWVATIDQPAKTGREHV